jgi:hypothetical protein
MASTHFGDFLRGRQLGGSFLLGLPHGVQGAVAEVALKRFFDGSVEYGEMQSKAQHSVTAVSRGVASAQGIEEQWGGKTDFLDSQCRG